MELGLVKQVLRAGSRDLRIAAAGVTKRGLERAPDLGGNADAIAHAIDSRRRNIFHHFAAEHRVERVREPRQLVGFDIDLLKAVATTLKISIHENNVTFDNILAGIDSGKYQIGNSSFTDEKSREKQVNFVDYFQAGEGVYAKSSSTVKFTGLMSLCGLNVAVESGTSEQQDAVSTAKKCPASKKLTVSPFPTQTEANLAVSSGHSSVGFLDSQVAGYVVSTSKGAFKLVGNAIEVAPYGIATPKTTTGKGLAKAIQAAVKTLIANGTYAEILAKWGVSAGAIPTSKIVLNGALS